MIKENICVNKIKSKWNALIGIHPNNYSNDTQSYVRELDSETDYGLKETLSYIDTLHYSGQVLNSSEFKITMNLNDYLYSTLLDVKFNLDRIENHIKTLEHLISDKSISPAWKLVTSYYACYYIVIDLNRLYGHFLLNLNKEEMLSIQTSRIKDIANLNINTDKENNFPFEIRANPVEDGYMKEIELTFKVTTNKTHLYVWKYFRENFFNLPSKKEGFHNKYKDNRLMYFILYGNKAEHIKWLNPSELRNEWNYRNSSLYSQEGFAIGKEFQDLITNKDKAYDWYRRTDSVKDIPKNYINGISFLYHYLRNEITDIKNFFYPK